MVCTSNPTKETFYICVSKHRDVKTICSKKQKYAGENPSQMLQKANKLKETTEILKPCYRLFNYSGKQKDTKPA